MEEKERMKEIFAECLPHLEAISQILQKGGISSASGWFSGDGYFSLDGSGFNGWKVTRHSDGETRVYYEYREVLEGGAADGND